MSLKKLTLTSTAIMNKLKTLPTPISSHTGLHIAAQRSHTEVFALLHKLAHKCPYCCAALSHSGICIAVQRSHI